MEVVFRVTVALFFVAATVLLLRVVDHVYQTWLPWGTPLLGLLALTWVSLLIASVETTLRGIRPAQVVRALLALALMLGSAEAVFAVARSNSVSYYVWRPNITARIRPAPGQFPDVAEELLFTSNGDGLRGRDRHPSDTVRILAVGGSTTESAYIDDAETWPEVARNSLEARGARAWIGNAGKSGTSTVEHLVLFRTLVAEMRPDVTLALVGINDVLRPYVGEGPPPFGEDGLLQYEYLRAGRRTQLGMESSSLYWEVRRMVQVVERSLRWTRNVHDAYGPALLRARERRQAAQRVDELPADFSRHLAAYEGRLRQLATAARAVQTRLIFLTQPALYFGPLGPEEIRVLSIGHWALPGERSDQHDPALGPERYFSERTMATMLQRYNATTLSVCREEGLTCLDLAALVPGDTRHMFDDVHFNRGGSRVVGEAVAELLVGRGLVRPK